MRPIEKAIAFRVIDANLNRAKEALRVCEDVARFGLDLRSETRRYKDLRHALAGICFVSWGEKKALTQNRNIQADVGRGDSQAEFRRRNIKDIFWANSQRAKEALRVLEEFMKLICASRAGRCKRIRYAVYELERRILKKF